MGAVRRGRLSIVKVDLTVLAVFGSMWALFTTYFCMYEVKV